MPTKKKTQDAVLLRRRIKRVEDAVKSLTHAFDVMNGACLSLALRTSALENSGTEPQGKRRRVSQAGRRRG